MPVWRRSVIRIANRLRKGKRIMSNELDKLKQSPLFGKILNDAPNIERDLDEFNQAYGSFVKKDDELVSVVLRSHLIVEHFLDEYLHAANPAIENWGHARLTFAQKLAIADNSRSKVRLLMPGLKALNSLRNSLVHSLEAEFDETKIQPIVEFVSIWKQALGYPIPSGIEFIEAFALTASGWLHSDTKMILRHAPKSGLLGLLDWCNEG